MGRWLSGYRIRVKRINLIFPFWWRLWTPLGRPEFFKVFSWQKTLIRLGIVMVAIFLKIKTTGFNLNNAILLQQAKPVYCIYNGKRWITKIIKTKTNQDQNQNKQFGNDGLVMGLIIQTGIQTSMDLHKTEEEIFYCRVDLCTSSNLCSLSVKGFLFKCFCTYGETGRPKPDSLDNSWSKKRRSRNKVFFKHYQFNHQLC